MCLELSALLSADREARALAFRRHPIRSGTASHHCDGRKLAIRRGMLGILAQRGQKEVRPDKRTKGGWYITRDGEIGRVLQPATRREFSTIQDAVAEYVVLELDFWARAGVPVECVGARGVFRCGACSVMRLGRHE
jgi:hypothetical protein